MSDLTEAEIFDCLTENFRIAAECCEKLAVVPRKGPTYRLLLDALEKVEGACRQAAYWRQDTRWLPIGLYMEEAHKRAGSWLRGYKTPQGQRIRLADEHRHPLFLKLAENLRAGMAKAQEFREKATGTIGTILPVPLPAPTRTQGRPVQVLLPSTPPTEHRTRAGLIVPSGVALQ